MAEYSDTKIDLVLNHMSKDIFEELKVSGQLSANEIYLVDEDYLDALSNTVQNVADPILSSDAANKHYVDAVSTAISSNLFSEISSIQDSLSEFLSALMVEITWEELSAIRSNSELIPGMSYRITDYETTVDVVGTELENLAQSAGNQFDLIVVADSVSSLNEVAHAVRHEGDSYFPESTKFEAWKVWYCLDNDKTRFLWADTENGRGVIYRLIDEFNNDVPYDFKNIQFIPYTKEEDWSDGMRYTFNDGEGNDASLLAESGVNSNAIQPYSIWYYDGSTEIEYRLFVLNRIVFLGNECSENSFGSGCFGNSFGNYCYGNSFGNDCYYNSFGNNCFGISFGNDCYYNSFGNNCFGISFGNECSDNSFGNFSELKDYYRYITIESGNRYIYLDCTNPLLGTENEQGNIIHYQNVTVKSGTNNKDDGEHNPHKTISDQNVGQTFHTTYQPANSIVVSV